MTGDSPKDAAKRSLARLLASVRPGNGAGRTVILCYHSIHPHKSFASATPGLFDRHLAWLSEHAELVRLADVRRGGADGSLRVAITFDDGYADNWEYAFPLLVEHGAPATFFLTAGLLERDEQVLARFAGTLRRCAPADVEPLSWEQVLEMRAGGAEFGSHTYSHPNLGRLGSDEALRELRLSREIIEQRLQQPVTDLAYPFGKPRRHLTRATVEAAAAAGYTRAVAVITRALRQSDRNLELPRIIVGGDDLATLHQKIAGAWDFLGWWQERAPLWAVDALRPGDAGF